MPGVMLLEGSIDRAGLEKAFRGLIARHETLRTGFEIVRRSGTADIPEADFAVGVYGKRARKKRSSACRLLSVRSTWRSRRCCVQAL